LDGIYYPENQTKYVKRDCIPEIPAAWFAEAQDHATEEDCAVIGDVHSHPYGERVCSAMKDRVQGENDLDSMRTWMRISGICVVHELANGKLRASVRWWGPTTPVDVEYT
jgi:proteasome lid subunit RPN8/RPN11